MSDNEFAINVNSDNSDHESETSHDEETQEDPRQHLVCLPLGDLDIEIDIYDSEDGPVAADLKILGLIAKSYIEREFRNNPKEVSKEIDGDLLIREVNAPTELVQKVNEAIGSEDGTLWFRQYDQDDFVVCFSSSWFEFDMFFNVKDHSSINPKKPKDGKNLEGNQGNE